jgi:choline dehydrogenase-like flavoprotein
MGLYAELPADINSVNVIIAGGGTAGCIVAARLAEKDPSLSILVLEAGPNGAGNPTVDYPALFLANMATTTTTAAFFKSNKSSGLGDREIIVPTGNVLGGGSAINMMQYSHAQRSDWDSWKIPGWSADEVMPFIKNVRSPYFRVTAPSGV